MENLILGKKEAQILKECLPGEKETREQLKNIFISGKHIYSTDGKRAVKLTKNDNLQYPADGVYKIIAETKLGTIGSELVIEKQDMQYPAEIISIMSGFYFIVFEITIRPEDKKSTLILDIWEKSGRAIDSKFLEILYKILNYDRIEILSQVREKTNEKPIIIRITNLNIDYIVLPYKYGE